MSSSKPEPDYKALVREALVQINLLKGKLRQQEDARHGPIAIVGYGCRLPGEVQDERSLRGLLQSTSDAIDPTASARFNLDPIYDPLRRRPGKTYARAMGLISGYESFDAGFFGLSDIEAERLDPQQRLLLETSWEALERAGIVPETLAGTHTGVYVGISTQEYAQAASLQRQPEEFAACDGPGSSLAVAAGRLSYFYGFNGPALAIDTACSSVLVCVQQGMQALRDHSVDTVLAGGVNLIINPLMMLVFSQAGVLSGNGQQRCFDAEGDGYVRGEACTMVALKRLQDAMDEGLPVLAVLNGGAVNHGGRSQGITTPSEGGQQAVIQAALDDAGMLPGDVDCVEAHATGTRLGDFIELSALHAVYGAERQRPLWLSSVKARVGHAETGSAGPALLSAIQQLRDRRLAGQLHFSQPNPLFDWHQSSLQVAAQAMDWPGVGVMAVSGFGYNGTNAHLILSAAPDPENGQHIRSELTPLSLHGLKLSARSADAVQALAAKWSEWLPHMADDQLPAILAMANAGRSDFEWRIWVAGQTIAELTAGCAALARGEGLPLLPVRSSKIVPVPGLPLTAQGEQELLAHWIKGASLAWRTLYPQLEPVDIPTYPFQRRRFWPSLSNSLAQRAVLQRMSQMNLFLGQHFPAPDGCQYHGYWNEDLVTLAAGYRVHGHNGIPPLWPLAAVCSAQTPAVLSFAALVWGEWPRLQPDHHLHLHTNLAASAVELQWSEQQEATTGLRWRQAFRASVVNFAAQNTQTENQPCTTAASTSAKPHIDGCEWQCSADVGAISPVAPALECGTLFQRQISFRKNETWLEAMLDVALIANPLGSWMDPHEVEQARVWLTLFALLQAGFDVCQQWAGPGNVLLPASAEQLQVNVPGLLDCLGSQTALTSRYQMLEDAGAGVQAHWQLLNAEGHALVRADNIVLFRVDAERLGGRASLQESHARMPSKVDLLPYRQLLDSLAGLNREQITQPLQDLLVSQLSEITATQVSAEMSLLALGIDSLWAIDFRTRLQQELGLNLSLGLLMKGPSLTELAEFLAQQIEERGSVAAQDQASSVDQQHPHCSDADTVELML